MGSMVVTNIEDPYNAMNPVRRLKEAAFLTTFHVSAFFNIDTDVRGLLSITKSDAFFGKLQTHLAGIDSMVQIARTLQKPKVVTAICHLSDWGQWSGCSTTCD